MNLLFCIWKRKGFAASLLGLMWALRAVGFLLFLAPSVGRIKHTNMRVGVIEVRGKLLAAFVLVLVGLMFMPVMAKSIGPQKAVKNPHIMVAPEGVELMLPSGGVLEWMADTTVGAIDFMHGLDASKARIPKAMPLSAMDLMGLMTDPEAALAYENKWGFISYDVLVELLVLEGFTQEEAEEMASMWPDGVYVRFVNVGKNWNS